MDLNIFNPYPDCRSNFNFVSSPTHYDYLRQACQDTGVEALGYLRKCQSIEIPSRHLGLSIDTEFCLDEFAEQVATEVEKTIDIQRLLEVTSQPFPQPAEESTEAISPASGLRISIAKTKHSILFMRKIFGR